MSRPSYSLTGVVTLYGYEKSNELTNSIEQSSWEANSRSANQVITRLLWKLKVHSLLCSQELPLAPLLYEINPVHTIIVYFLTPILILSHIRGLHDLWNGFWILWSHLLDLYITCYSISQITIFDWALSTSDHTTSPTELSVIVVFSSYSLGADHTENTSIVWQRMSSVLAYSLPWDVFIESLPSNGSMRHNIIPSTPKCSTFPFPFRVFSSIRTLWVFLSSQYVLHLSAKLVLISSV
jgi:hypothetical protein